MQSSVSTAVELTAVFLAVFFPLLCPPITIAQAKAALKQLPNGLHQFCTEPEPQNWQLGAGVCFWFRKQGAAVVGYYGYPHSDHLIDCISGQIQASQQISGQALFLDWAGDKQQGLQHKSRWDTEGHLTLNSIPIVHPIPAKAGYLALIQIRSISLDLTDFYEYSPQKVQQMKPPPISCDLSLWKKQAMSSTGALP